MCRAIRIGNLDAAILCPARVCCCCGPGLSIALAGKPRRLEMPATTHVTASPAPLAGSATAHLPYRSSTLARMAHPHTAPAGLPPRHIGSSTPAPPPPTAALTDPHLTPARPRCPCAPPRTPSSSGPASASLKSVPAPALTPVSNPPLPCRTESRSPPCVRSPLVPNPVPPHPPPPLASVPSASELSLNS